MTVVAKEITKNHNRQTRNECKMFIFLSKRSDRAMGTRMGGSVGERA